MQEKIVTRLLIATLSCRFLFGHYSAVGQVLSCDPSEIGHNHQVVLKVNTSCNAGIPRIASRDGVLATCPNYTILGKNKQKYNLTLLKTPDELTLILHIHNVTMINTGSAPWFQIHDNMNKTNKSCTLSVYLKASELNCYTNITKNEISFECWSSRMYPNGDCVFDTNLKIGTYETNVTTINDTTQMKDVYFLKYCSLTIHVANLTHQKITVNVTVYPNVKGDTNDKMTYGTMTSNFVNVENPSVRIRNCPSTVKEGINATCHCERADASDVEVAIHWFDNVTLNSVSEGNVSFIGNRDLKAVYYCQSVNIFGWKSEPHFYQPKIASSLDRSHVDISTPVSIVEAVLLLISWIVVALLWVKLKRYTNVKGNMSAIENVELNQIRANDDGYLIPIDLTNINVGQQVRGDYDSLDPYHCYEAISRVES